MELIELPHSATVSDVNKLFQKVKDEPDPYHQAMIMSHSLQGGAWDGDEEALKKLGNILLHYITYAPDSNVETDVFSYFVQNHYFNKDGEVQDL